MIGKRRIGSTKISLNLRRREKEVFLKLFPWNKSVLDDVKEAERDEEREKKAVGKGVRRVKSIKKKGKSGEKKCKSIEKKGKSVKKTGKSTGKGATK